MNDIVVVGAIIAAALWAVVITARVQSHARDHVDFRRWIRDNDRWIEKLSSTSASHEELRALVDHLGLEVRHTPKTITFMKKR